MQQEGQCLYQYLVLNIAHVSHDLYPQESSDWPIRKNKKKPRKNVMKLQDKAWTQFEI